MRGRPKKQDPVCTHNPAGVERSMYVICPLGRNPLILGDLLQGLRYKTRREVGAYANSHKGTSNI